MKNDSFSEGKGGALHSFICVLLVIWKYNAVMFKWVAGLKEFINIKHFAFLFFFNKAYSNGF